MFNNDIAIEAFRNAGIEYLINVPVNGMTKIYNHYEEKNRCIYASREEEAVAIASGLSITGHLPLVFVQQSGVGNMLNAYIAFVEGYSIYFPILVLMRGIHDENPIQAISSKFTRPVIESFQNSQSIDFSDANGISLFAEGINKKTKWFISNYKL